MQGSPLKQFFLCLLAFCALAFSLYQVTASKNRAVVDHATPAERPQFINAWLSVKTSQPAESIRITLDGKLIGEWEGSVRTEECEVQVHEGMNQLEVRATWANASADSAIRITLEPEGLADMEQTKWSTGNTLQDIFRFNIQSPAPRQ